MVVVRKGILVVGLVLLLIGAVLLFDPLEPQSLPVNTAQSMKQTVSGAQVNSPLYSHSFDISWTSNVSGEMTYKVCNGIWTPSSSVSCSVNSTQSGTSGKISLSVPNGQYVLLFFTSSATQNPSVSVTTKTTIPTGGVILAVLGLLLVIAGAIRKSSPKPAADTLGPGPSQSPPQQKS